VQLRHPYLEEPADSAPMNSAAPQSPIGDLLWEAAAVYPDRAALVYGSEHQTYAELAERAQRLAGGLASRGLGPGDPIALIASNSPAFVTTFFAVAALGAVIVPLSPQFEEAELEFYFRECGVRAAIADPKRANTASRISARLDRPVDVISTGRPSRRGVSFGSLLDGDPIEHREISRDEDFVFHYSSGSTGRPKRSPRTHRQVQAEVDNLLAAIELQPEDRILCTIPLVHSYGMGCCLLSAVRSGATLLLDEAQPMVLRRMRILKLLENEEVTVFPTVPYVLRLLTESSVAANLERLRLCFSAAAALPRPTFDAFLDKFGVPIRQLYGCTETGVIAVNMDDDPVATAASVGRPIGGVEIRVVDEAGEPCTRGHIGAVAVSSSAMTRGYPGLDEQNRIAFGGGCFMTGDRGRIDDDGRLFITGRTKLLIDVLGEKVDPIEVEDVLATHPKVREVVVVGVTSAIAGEERVKAVIVPEPETACGERELIRFCRERLARYKVPELVEFRDEIPKGPSGRTLRKYLVE
jgi:long-chain acyl-CoA synthetase